MPKVDDIMSCNPIEYSEKLEDIISSAEKEE